MCLTAGVACTPWQKQQCYGSAWATEDGPQLGCFSLPPRAPPHLRRGEVVGEAGRRSAAGAAGGARGRASEPCLLLPLLGRLQRGPPSLGQWRFLPPGSFSGGSGRTSCCQGSGSRASTSHNGCRCGFTDETQPPNACNLL